jgi:hypothetical protein
MVRGRGYAASTEAPLVWVWAWLRSTTDAGAPRTSFLGVLATARATFLRSEGNFPVDDFLKLA